MTEKLIGIFEVAEIAEVSPSAVANWRKRFVDFPAPLAELKSGPVFSEGQIKIWLARRGAHTNESPELGLYYEQLASKRGDDSELRQKVDEVVDNLLKQKTSTKRPGILLGKVQSGKTRAFLGVIARAFDKGFDVAIIMTKGTKSLVEQTLSRVKSDFRDFITNDMVEVFDVLAVPKLTPYELAHKLVFVLKKEDDNLRHLLEIFQVEYPELQHRSVLLIDDEADLASVSFRKINGVNTIGVISQQIDYLRNIVSNLAFLQVTATPYALYLQPDEDEIIINQTSLFKPKRPAFTVILPTHNKYVGGDEYFEKSSDPDSSAFYFYREVPLPEREALKKEDRRRLQIDRVLTEKNSSVLRDAIVSFIVGGAIRRLQQKAINQKQEKYSFLFHTEQTRAAHEWQEMVAGAIRNNLIAQAEADSPLFSELIRAAYNDFKRSISIEQLVIPELELLTNFVKEALIGGQLMITKVNSDNEIKALLDEEGQLKLRTPFNMFIGGQILDRGITINNLIGFYYGRNPNRFQQDTVLQHSRMYGARSLADLTVTRFYAPKHIYKIMKRIHEFDAALRDAFIDGEPDKGIYFIQKDASNKLIPCSPNKLLFSDVVSIRPGRRLVSVGFQTVSKTVGKKNLEALDLKIANLEIKSDEPILISVDVAVELLELAYSNLTFDDVKEDERDAHIAALDYVSHMSKSEEWKDKVVLMIARDRNITRYREEGRFSNSPDTKQQKDLAKKYYANVPVLMLLRQNGDEARGWKGLPFWWPVIMTPQSSTTVIFSTDQAAEGSTTTLITRKLKTENID